MASFPLFFAWYDALPPQLHMEWETGNEVDPDMQGMRIALPENAYPEILKLEFQSYAHGFFPREATKSRNTRQNLQNEISSARKLGLFSQKSAQRHRFYETSVTLQVVSATFASCSISALG